MATKSIPSPPDLFPPEAFSAMKIRTCLLAAFGLVVPLIAMFSHLIPSGFTDAAWAFAWQPAAALFSNENEPEAARTPPTEPLPPETAHAASPLAGPAADTPTQATLVVPTVTIGSEAIAAAGSPAASWPTATVRRPPGEVESPLWSTAADSEPAFASPVGLATSGVTGFPSNGVAESALIDAGAFGITCQPTAGGRFYHCSCRVAADPTGQLVRMFHATETDPQQAMERLLTDVRQWQAASTAAPHAP